jgi:cyanophycin synthetase
MKVESIKVFNGVNFFTHRPAVVASIDYEGMQETNTRAFPHLIHRLFERFPLLIDHRCSDLPGETFSARLAEGTHIAHAIEHVALELFDQIETDLERKGRCKCGVARTKHDRLVVETRAAEVMRYLIPRAVDIVDALVYVREPVLENVLVPAEEILANVELGPSGRCIVEAAEKLGIPWSRQNDHSLVQLGYGRNLHFVQAAMTDLSSDIGVDIVGNKSATKKRLQKFSIPTPPGFVVATEDEAVAAFERLNFPVAVKPLNANKGKGITLEIATADDVRLAFHHAQQFSSRVLIEELLHGNNYRVLVVGGKMVAAAERKPGIVIGDGKQTLEQLVETENENPLRGDGHEKPLTKFKLVPAVVENLLKKGVSLTDVIPAGQEVEVSVGMNLSTGGTARDVTDEVHRSVQLMCERAARVVNLDVCGIDLMLRDISLPLPQERGGIIEINAAPGLRMHLHPSEGESRDVGRAIIEMLYPNNASSRIPIIAVTGTNGKTTVTRMISHILGTTGRNIGTTTTDGIMINGESIVFGDTTGPASARTILSDKLVDIAVLETARGGIIRRGLGWDWADIAVVTNITEDHIGQDGIESVKDLVEIKSLIAERVRDGGTVILNADDEESAGLASRPAIAGTDRSIVFFSTQIANPIIQRHLDAGGIAYFLKDGWITESGKGVVEKLVDTALIPVTIDGTAEYQVQNAMAATAAARGMGMSGIMIAEALRTFSGVGNNRGRTNIYRVKEGLVVVDYGHNPKAIESIGNMISKWGMPSTGIISVPGDRRDDVIEACAIQAAKAFDRIILKSDKDLRGRKEGELAEMMIKMIEANGGPRDTTIENDPFEALEGALSTIVSGEVVVFFYEKLEPAIPILEKYQAVPTENVLVTVATPVTEGRYV